MKNNVYKFKSDKIPEKQIVYKENKKKKIIRLCALLGALLMFGGFCFSLIMYIL